MLTRILWVGLLAGIVAGLATAALQHVTTTPLIIAAEAYEKNGEAEATALPGLRKADLVRATERGPRFILAQTAEEKPNAAANAWGPKDGLERTFYTSLATVVATIGYSLMLLAAILISGDRITARTGLAWAAAAFVVSGLAPGLGLAPELPGAAAGDLHSRQIWWVGTAVATAAGLWLALRISSPWAIGLGLTMIAAPHIAGAPHPPAFTSGVPPELAAHFASTSLAVHAIAWALTGIAIGYLWQRDEARADTRRSAIG